jgi:hypothetical protein
MYLRSEYEVSQRRACQAMQMLRSNYRYVGQQPMCLTVVDEIS